MEWMLHVAILGAFHYFYRVMVFDYIDSTYGIWFFLCLHIIMSMSHFFFLLIGLWFLITLIQQTEYGFSISLILLALSLICFFFLSKKNPSFYIFLLLIGIVMAHALILGDAYFTALLLLFVLILASSRL